MRCESWLGESCKSCPTDCGVCPSCDNICGNKRCEPGESACNCPQDCGACCVDGFCRGAETAINCPQDCTTDLVGSVYDQNVFLPLPGALVSCQGEKTLEGQLVTAEIAADANGRFKFTKLPAGYYTCSAKLGGYHSGATNIFFAAGLYPTPIPEVRIGLVSQSGSISGELRDAMGAYLRHVNVTCRTMTVSSATQAVINKPYFKFSSQNYFFFALTPGNYSCEAGKEGYSSAAFNTMVTLGKNSLVHFRLAALPVTFSGTVQLKNIQTRPVERVPVSANITCSPSFPVTAANITGSSAADGKFALTLQPGVSYRCTASTAPGANLPAVTKGFVVDFQQPNTTVVKNLMLALGK
eukprot:TRINITY_DN3395_c0_g1_i1.p1 TRINITY_DN3395_c0_g1~~TRINITY_DN3395_c0_g1_i1.p1  ORF type:complete len:354 (+),score=123.17 TRINITY_DN3395_c0_g1_i1:37-1098(+)